jgi:hypothetical protein
MTDVQNVSFSQCETVTARPIDPLSNNEAPVIHYDNTCAPCFQATCTPVWSSSPDRPDPWNVSGTYNNSNGGDGCCDPPKCYTNWISQIPDAGTQITGTNRYAQYYQPCCIKAEFHNVKARQSPTVPPLADFGYQMGLPDNPLPTSDVTDRMMNPTVLYRYWDCTGAVNLSLIDYYSSRPYGPLNPFPTQLAIMGSAYHVVEYSSAGGGYFQRIVIQVTFVVSGGDTIGVEDYPTYKQPRPVSFTTAPMTFHLKEPTITPAGTGSCWSIVDTPQGADPSSGATFTCEVMWLGPVFDLANFVNIRLDLDSACLGSIFESDGNGGYLNEYLEDYRGPAYQWYGANNDANSYILLTLCDPADKTYQKCHNEPGDCSTLANVWGWKLDWSDGYSRPKSATFTKLDSSPLHWSHPLWPWVIAVEKGSNRSSRDGVCELRLDFSPEKLADSYGFVFPSGYGPCPSPDSVPSPSQVRFTDQVPFDADLRYQYLAANVLPGSTMTLQPECKPPSPVAQAANCTNCCGWIVDSSYGFYQFTGSSGSDGSSGYTYTVTRLADGQFGQGNYNLKVELNDTNGTTFNCPFTSGNAIDCCDAGSMSISLGLGSGATIAAYCPTECDSTCWLAEFTCADDDSVYGCALTYQWWQFWDDESASGSTGTVLVNVVRLSGDRYFVIRDIYLNVSGVIDQHFYSYATIQAGADCKTGGPWSVSAKIRGFTYNETFSSYEGYELDGTITIRMPDTQTPTGSDKTVTTQRGGASKTEYIFTPANFQSTSVPAVSIRINSLPVNGVLWTADDCNSDTFSGLDGAGQHAITSVPTLIAAACITNGCFGYIANQNCAFASPFDAFTFQLKGAGGCSGDDALDPHHCTIKIDVTRAANTPPTGAASYDLGVTVPASGVKHIDASIFGFSDSGDNPCPDNFAAVYIITLPTVGVLKIANVAVTAGQRVTVAQLESLIYDTSSAVWPIAVPGHFDTNAPHLWIPTTYAYPSLNAVYDSFTFRVQDDGGTANGGNDTQTGNPGTISIRNASE